MKIKATLLILALLTLHGCTANNNNNNKNKPKVAASIFALYDITRNIAGDKIEVINLLKAQSNPHAFELSPSVMIQLRDTNVLFIISHGIDNWAINASKGVDDIEIVPVDKNINLMEYQYDHEEEGHEEEETEGKDPHYWLSVQNAKIMAKNIQGKLTEISPENAVYFDENYEKFSQELDSLYDYGKAKLSSLENNKMIVFHESMNYFANEFGLDIVGVFEPSPGIQASPKFLKDIYDTAKNHQVKALFSEPQLPSATIKPFTQDLNLKLYVLDPMESSTDQNSYIKIMKKNIDTIEEALK
jgi:zinc transport system substrate-binding protein